jgi:hypothetical protein
VTATTRSLAAGHDRISRRDRAVARLRLRRLDRRLDRSWRRAVADGDAVLLAALRRQTGKAVIAVTAIAVPAWRAGPGTDNVAAELTVGPGARIRLGPCHGPSVVALAEAVGTGHPVVLARVRRCNRLWVLDFTGPGPGSLLGRSASHQEGGIRRRLAVA